MSAQLETWRVSTVEGVFEADLETLKQWISEGAVLPTDKVSKGSLSWIEAGRAPMLRSAFAGEVAATATVTASEAAVLSSSVTNVPSWNDVVPPPVMPPIPVATAAPAQVCHNHAELARKYVCRACSNAFCDEGPRFFGTSKIPLCPLCGDLCSIVEKLKHQAARRELQSSG